MDRAAKVKLINTATGDPRMRAKLVAMIDEAEVEAPATPVEVVEPQPVAKKKAKKKVAKKRSKK